MDAWTGTGSSFSAKSHRQVGPSFALDNRSKPAESSGSSSLLLTPNDVVDGAVAVEDVVGVDGDVGKVVEMLSGCRCSRSSTTPSVEEQKVGEMIKSFRRESPICGCVFKWLVTPKRTTMMMNDHKCLKPQLQQLQVLALQQTGSEAPASSLPVPLWGT